ncbi:epidermal growth factor receptor kinase substrate 8-like protein 3 [Denticeps clupeoides]|uniref:epidermal growth factor receptor kinase substrate 8-like protein 3 n=1 Tax=Denticeps clupeoides TaxID=299321 RepID=UPI0010A30601|nr:epidermal growth factor receptor kinase substrate 8-like protein 3 [Denticeps clupeoides]
MFQINSPHGLPSRGFSYEEPSIPRPSVSRPSGKSIYLQRKEYSESISQEPENFLYRVEHLLTCELNGQQIRSLDDCVTRLKHLDSKGKVWGQEMILEVQGNALQLSDTETKEELESLPLTSITQTAAVLDSCDYTSLLMVTVHKRHRRFPQVFLFQCDDVGAKEIKVDLDKIVGLGGQDSADAGNDQVVDIRRHLENIIGQKLPGRHGSPTSHTTRQESHSPPPPPRDHTPPQWGNDDHTEPRFREGPVVTPPEEPSLQQPQNSEVERNVEIFNHVLSDIEFFTGKVSASLQQDDQDKKKNKKNKKEKGPGQSLPPLEEYFSYLQKMKYGFNLLGKLNGKINNPSAPEFIHHLFGSLNLIFPWYSSNVASSVVTPLMTEDALFLLSQTVTPGEHKLWSSLGDAWRTPRSEWPNGDQIPAYLPVFYDGWQIPMPVPPNSQNWQGARDSSQRFPSRSEYQQESAQDRRARNLPSTRSSEPPLLMRVIYNLVARNSQELSVMRGEMVQVLEKSRQWWKVRNSRGAEGSVPHNILEPVTEEPPKDTDQYGHMRNQGAPSLDTRSTPAEVRAWLQYKGFSKSTLNCLSVFNGELLLTMSQNNMRMICPDEGGRVFFQLQAVKSSLALASEAGPGQYNGF